MLRLVDKERCMIVGIEPFHPLHPHRGALNIQDLEPMEFATARKNKVLVMRKLYASIVPDIGDEACYTIIPTAVLEDNNLQFALRIHHVECPIANGKRHLLVISIEIDIRIAAYLRPDVCHILVQTELNLQHWRILRHIVVLMKNLQAVVAAY